MKNYCKHIGFLLLTFLVTLASYGQMYDPVTFSAKLVTNGTAEAEIVFTGKIEPGWHVYSTGLGGGGPISATFNAGKLEGVMLVGKLKAVGNEIKQHDPLFNMPVRFFEGSVTFVQKILFTKPNYSIDGYLEYGACNDQNCLPPTAVDFKQSGKSPAVGGKNPKEAAKEEVPAEQKELPTSAQPVAAADTVPAQRPVYDLDTLREQPKVEAGDLWKPVVDQLQAQDGSAPASQRAWIYIFLMGFAGGLLALFTPCVWPIIPMTVSFFLKRAGKDKGKGIRDAVTYGVSIVAIYMTLGLVVTAIFGASALNALATNAVFNILFCLLLVIFALSFFGWFEIRLPDKWGNAVDSKASATTGLLSIFLMAFTLALVSFSCTGPIVGFLLVDFATSGNLMGPAVGMLGFSLALALPFTLFAMFPSWLKSAPRSGSWMNTIKVTLGFIELAFALKFFSVADLAYGWHLMDREVFLSLWIVIFAALGLYLMGLLKFRGDVIEGEPTRPMPVPCIMLGLCSLAFAVYMLPGLWGAPCKAVSAFAPPMNTQDFNFNNKEVHAPYSNYEEGMAAAKAQGKPVLLDFTGFGCVNCRKMEAAVWTDPQVADILQKDYVLISLFVDDKTPLPEPVTITENGKQRTLRTVGDKWSYLQRHKFGANAQPFYVPVDNQGNPLNGSYSYKEDVGEYLDFLRGGLENYGKR